MKKNRKFLVKSANVVNKGIQPNLLSIIIDRGTVDGVQSNLPVLTPKGVVCIFWCIAIILAVLGISIFFAADNVLHLEFEY